ncbi:hypothetical protein ASE14_02175 [Agromyces sp. Root81]|uniref:helix-turn-helix domain-containing protein n=1 Tax=Agromyces sp. Root81 TaxID=1736601 RepID=UPI0006F9D2DF|nr:helix-turn-helix transcriptional regulator [Agromyces sp. Root81]KRC62658.1 hypothetical protein ASE14_02175 [Agromyces sp. Root81]
MRREIEYQWRIRELMAKRRIKNSTELVEPLRERGITLSTSQVYRLVAQDPERIAFKVLVALCDILQCEVNDLVTFTAVGTRTMCRLRSHWVERVVGGASDAEFDVLRGELVDDVLRVTE